MILSIAESLIKGIFPFFLFLCIGSQSFGLVSIRVKINLTRAGKRPLIAELSLHENEWSSLSENELMIKVRAGINDQNVKVDFKILREVNEELRLVVSDSIVAEWNHWGIYRSSKENILVKIMPSKGKEP